MKTTVESKQQDIILSFNFKCNLLLVILFLLIVINF